MQTCTTNFRNKILSKDKAYKLEVLKQISLTINRTLNINNSNNNNLGTTFNNLKINNNHNKILIIPNLETIVLKLISNKTSKPIINNNSSPTQTITSNNRKTKCKTLNNNKCNNSMSNVNFSYRTTLNECGVLLWMVRTLASTQLNV